MAWPAGITPEMTIASTDRAGVSIGLASAWCAPDGWAISHEEVAAVAKAYPGRIFGVAGANLYKPMAAVRELRRVIKEQGFKALWVVPWLYSPPERSPLLSALCRMHRTWHPVLHTGGAYRSAAPVRDRQADTLPRRSGP
jgi:predicted TIM-barrel fold metal-dependent hydrolase